MDRIFGQWEQNEQNRQDKQKIPVFVDSPLGLKITKIYSRLSEYWDKEAKALLDAGDHPIDFENLYAVEDHRSHLKLTDIDGPAVILAGSGMCTGGRIINHLVTGLKDSRNDLLFVGYQAAGTPGRDIVRFAKKQGGYVRLDGQRVDIHASVHELTGYSAHADQKDLVNWVNAMEKRPGTIRLVHGEPEAKKALSKILGL
jgi:metallo-beta-lactamase family protein